MPSLMIPLVFLEVLCVLGQQRHGVEWNEPLLADPNTVLGDSSGIKGCSQTNEVASCEYGSLVTDVIRETGRKAGLNTQVAFWNSGSFVTGLPAGPVKAADILSMHQDGDRIVFFSLKGSVLLKVIEYMLAQRGDGRDFSWLVGFRWPSICFDEKLQTWWVVPRPRAESGR